MIIGQATGPIPVAPTRMNNELKDEEILLLAQEDPAYFSILVDKYKEPFLRMARGITHNLEEAEDIVQDTFIRIYRHASRFEKQEGIQFKSWAYKVLMNTAFTHYQKLKKTKGNVEYLDPVLYDDNPNLASSGIDAIMQSDAKATIDKVLAKMPEHLARPLRIYYFEDKAYEDIARSEKISISTLKMRMFRAKRLFKKLMEEDL